ncbi:Uncharacterized protein FWK35_00029771 [Aphis craccivora]|uniref:Uncharacterized protein n=1 Tax=Aphis craccivora TaxID=307492 RepID=A0A6G0VVM4_APHCR|nr:Uncharacterized protein FWK35_00029771 [Aphis craccivora]
MKLASGLRYFQNSESNINDEREDSSMGSESRIINNLNEYENWYGKGRPLKINNTTEKCKVTREFNDSENDTVNSEVNYSCSLKNSFDAESMEEIQWDSKTEQNIP